MEKYSDELNNIELFRYLYDDFPSGKLIRTESPDFIVKDGPGNSLGIEITHVMDRYHAEKVSSDSPGNLTKKLLLLHCRDIFEYYSDLKINVALYFREDAVLKPGRIVPSAGIIAKTILSRTEGKRPGEAFHMHFIISGLRELLDSVTIFRFPGISESAWEDAGVFVTPGIGAEMIRKTVIHKEEKLRLYQQKKLRYYWLLLIVDVALNGPGIPDPGELMRLSDTRFNKVFLLERRVGRLFRLS